MQGRARCAWCDEPFAILHFEPFADQSLLESQIEALEEVLRLEHVDEKFHEHRESYELDELSKPQNLAGPAHPRGSLRIVTATEFEIGDLVRSRSGGPLMTIFRIATDETAYCRWLVGTKYEWGVFALSSLVPAST